MLRKKAKDMYSAAEGILGYKKHHEKKLSGQEVFTHEDEEGNQRRIIIRWIKILNFPQLKHNRKLRFHVVFFVNLPYWNIKEIKGLRNLCLSCVDLRYVSNSQQYKKLPISIYISGKQKGAFSYKHVGVKKHLVKNNSKVVNTNIVSCKKSRFLILKQLYRLFGAKTYKLKESIEQQQYISREGGTRNKTLFGALRSFWELLLDFRNFCHDLSKKFYNKLKEYHREKALKKREKSIRISNTFNKNENLSREEKKQRATDQFYDLLSQMGAKKRKKRRGRPV